MRFQVSLSEVTSFSKMATDSAPITSLAPMELGIDVGTTSVKVALVDIRKRKSVATSKLDHARESRIQRNDPALYEQNPVVILKKVDMCIAECLKGIDQSILKSISTINVSGQMHGVVLWSDSHNDLDENYLKSEHYDFNDIGSRIDLKTNLITWEDKRCSDEFLSSLPECNSPIFSGYGCATLFWLCENDKDAVKSSEHSGSIMDLLVSYLCGLKHPVMSEQIAYSWGYYEKDNRSWQSQLLESKGFPVKQLPALCMVGNNAGLLMGEWYGIPKGTSVKVAMGDFQCAFLSSSRDTGTAVMNIGTSSQLAIIVPKTIDIDCIQRKYPALQFFPYFDDCQLAVAASLNGGNVFDKFAMVFKSWLRDLELPDIDSDYLHRSFKNLCKDESDLIANDLVIMPTLHGERHCPHQGASAQNIRDDNISLKNVVKQLYIGIVNNLFEMMPVECLKTMGADHIACTGSLFNDNEYLRQAIEKISGLPCILNQDADAVYGAAFSSYAQ